MTSYAGLDVSEQATHVCVVDAAGKVVFRGVCRTEPAVLHELLTERAPDLGRAVLETGALASWLTHGLVALGAPVVCVCARQAHAARTFMAVIDDPGRFRSSQEVGAYLGLVPRRWPSGQLDQAGRITRCGDGLLRHLLYEGANVVLSILKKPCGLKAWAERLEARVGARKARVALARKLAVLMHRLWVTGEAYDRQRQPQAA